MSNVIEFSVRAIDDFSATMSKLQGQMSSVEKGLVNLGVAATIYTALRIAEESLANAEAMGTQARQVNLSTDAYSRLAYAASQMNVESGTLNTSLKLLNRAMAEGESSDAGKALNLLGVSAKNTDGSLRNVQDVLNDVADAMAGATDDANKTQIALALFGRSGTQMLPMLNDGSEGMRKMSAQAGQLGRAIGDDFSSSADQVLDNLGNIGLIIKGPINEATKTLAPVLADLTGKFVDWAKEGDRIQNVGMLISGTFKIIESAVVIVVGSFKTLIDAISGVATAFVMLMTGKYQEAVDTLRNTSLDIKDNVVGTILTIGDVWGLTGEKVKDSAEKQKTSLRNLSAEQANAKSLAEQQKIAEDALNDARKEATAIIEGQQTPLEQHAARLDRINNLTAKGAMDLNEHTQAIERENAAWENAGLKLEDYKMTVTDVSDETSRMLEEKYNALGNTVFQQATLFTNATQQVVSGIGDSIASAIVDGGNLMDMLQQVARNVAKNVISTLIQIGIQRGILGTLDASVTKGLSMQKMAAGLAEVYVNTFASVAAIPVVGWALAPGIATANTAAAAAGSIAAGGTGAGIGGIFHGGMGYVPSESTYLLDEGERVLSPNQNADLTEFLAGGGSGGGMVIQNLTIHVLENATSADVFTRMDKIELRNMLGQPIIDALNEQFKFGIVPNFAARK